ncbi:MAG: hypothetical protein JKP98_01510 [Rhodobacteraceae bacterium]|nr:hypothetical protein [Paracoccaceae bacterium]
MPSHDPRAIANEFIKLNGGNMNQMKLQKLVYISHGWNLAINREHLVSGRIEAWMVALLCALSGITCVILG